MARSCVSSGKPLTIVVCGQVVVVSEMARKVGACIVAGRHDRMRKNRRAWRTGTTPIGTMPDGDGGMLEGGNCVRCCSTIWRKATR